MLPIPSMLLMLQIPIWGYAGAWGYGSMGIWGYGDMGIWGYEDMTMGVELVVLYLKGTRFHILGWFSEENEKW